MKITVSYIQIYNEQIDDLLEDSKNIKIIDDSDWGTVLQGSKRVLVKDFDSAIKLVKLGEEKRIYRETKIHEHSSRSHTIFKIFIETSSKIFSCLNIVDLAGSERLSETDNQHNSETCYINKSLFSLTNVINKLADKSKHIPYRDSKLTRLLRESLGGNSYMVLICCVSPARKNYIQTLSTLRFAIRAKKVQINPKTNNFGNILEQDQESSQMQELLMEIENLKKQNDQLIEEKNQLQNTLSQVGSTNACNWNQNSFYNFELIKQSCPNLSNNKIIQFLIQTEEEFRKQYDFLLEAYRKNLSEVLNQEALNLQENLWIANYIQGIIVSNQIPQFAQGMNWDNIITKDAFLKQVSHFNLLIIQICIGGNSKNTSEQIDSIFNEQQQQLNHIVSDCAQYLEYFFRKKQTIQINIQGEEISNLHLVKEHEMALQNCQSQYEKASAYLKQLSTQIKKYLPQLIPNQNDLITKDTLYKLKTLLAPLNKSILKQSNSIHCVKETVRKDSKTSIKCQQDYEVYIWGSGQDGRLGLKDTRSRKIPTQIENLKVVAIACGYHHTLALISPGQVFSWGRGQRGQLGLGQLIDCVEKPTLIEQLSNITQIDCGWQHSIALNHQGLIFTWGYGEDGQLGHGDLFNQDKPQLLQINLIASQIFAGHSNSAFLTISDELYIFGNNSDGRCMNPDLVTLQIPQLCYLSNILRIDKHLKIKSVSLGVTHMGIVLNTGEIFMAGQGSEGQLGMLLDESTPNTTTITFEEEQKMICFLAQIEKFGKKNRALQIACGDNYTLILNEKGLVYSCGKGSYCRLGQARLKGNENLFETTPILGLENVCQIVAGCRHAGTINQDGSIYLWGFNFHNQLGLGENDQDQADPIKIDHINGKKIVNLNLGYFHSAALIEC